MFMPSYWLKAVHSTTNLDFGRNGLTPFFSDVNGYVNVRKSDKEPESGITKTLTYSATQLIMPYIDNGKGPVSKNVKNTDLYPYVLDIPYSENQPFRWCIENKASTKLIILTKITERHMEIGMRLLKMNR